MRILVLFGPLCLSFRRQIDFSVLRTDPQGLTGSELGFARIAQELKALGHTVELSVVSPQTEFEGMRIGPAQGHYDVALAVNEPDILRGVDAEFRACAFWLNGFTHCQVGFDQHCDLYLSPSAPHLHEIMTREAWHAVAPIPSHPDGQERYTPQPEKWASVELGADWNYYDRFGQCPKCEGSLSLAPAAYLPPHEMTDLYCGRCGLRWGPPDESVKTGWLRATKVEKIRGRVVHCSSPDRGLHWLLQEWPIIKLAVPHATLHIFYRLEPWIRGFDATPYFPPIEPNRARALYVQEALQRLSDPKWGITLRDSVSRETIEREMAQAEVMAYPCDTLAWSEGFSCSLLEGCAARACPITTDCDALGGVYGEHLPLTKRNGRDPREWVPEWRAAVIGALKDAAYRDEVNKKARAFAERRTWRMVAENIMAEIEKRRHEQAA